jgi:hypothetical protein
MSTKIENVYKLQKGDEISVHFHGELMENYFAESNISARTGIRVAQFAVDKVLLLYMDDESRLKLLVDQADAKWTEYTLSQDGIKVTAFDIHHDTGENKLRVAFAGKEGKKSLLKISEPLALHNVDPLSTFNNFQWINKEIPSDHKEIDHVTMNAKGLLYSMNYTGEDATFAYCFYGNKIEPYTIPQNANRITQLEVGQMNGDFGVFLLYDTNERNEEKSMVFQPFPDPEYGEIGDVITFENLTQIEVFTTISDKLGESILFVAGDGMHKYHYTEAELENEEIVAPGLGAIFNTKMAAASQKEETTIWAIGTHEEESGLYYCTNRFYQDAAKAEKEITKKWTRPLMMQPSIEDFAAVKGDQLLNQLFLLDYEENIFNRKPKRQSSDLGDDGKIKLIHFWQDKISTNWHEQPLVIKNLNSNKKKETFTLNIEFSVENAIRSFQGEEVTISAEANLNVYIDEEKYIIGPEKKVTTKIKNDGKISLVYPTKSIAVPALYLEAEFLKGKEKIDPAHKLKEKIEEKMTSKESLRKAKKQDKDNTPLIGENVSDEDLEGVAQATHQMIDHSKELEEGAKVHYNFTGHPDAPSPNVGVSFYSFPSLSDIGHALGDVWHAAKKGFLKITKVIYEKVKDGFKFVVHIAGEVFEWVSKVASDVFHFLERVWEKIKVAFEDLFEFIAFLFSWDDILRTKDALKEYTHAMFDGLQDGLDGMQNEINGFFDGIQEKLKALSSENQLNSQDLQKIKKDNSKKGASDPRATGVIDNNKSGLSNGEASKVIKSQLPSEESSLIDKLANIFSELKNEIGDDIQALEESIHKVVSGDKGIGDFIKDFVLLLADAAIEIVQQIINLFFELLKALLDGIDKLLSAEIKIPFFSALYESVSGAPLSVLDLICLFIAIPTTVVYKLIEDEEPFGDKDVKNAYVASGRNMFSVFSNNDDTRTSVQTQPRGVMSFASVSGDKVESKGTKVTKVINGAVAYGAGMITALLFVPNKVIGMAPAGKTDVIPGQGIIEKLSAGISAIGLINNIWYHYSEFYDEYINNKGQTTKWSVLALSGIVAVKVGVAAYLIVGKDKLESGYDKVKPVINGILMPTLKACLLFKNLNTMIFKKHCKGIKPSLVMNTVNNGLGISEINFIDEPFKKARPDAYLIFQGVRAILLVVESTTLAIELAVGKSADN